MRPLVDSSDGAFVLIPVRGGDSIRFSYRLKYDGAPLGPSDLSVNGRVASADFFYRGGLAAEIEDTFEELSGIISVKRKWTLHYRGLWNLNASFSVPEREGAAEIFVPAVFYRGNAMGKGSFPRHATAPVWSFLETRTPVPDYVQIYGNSASFMCAAKPASSPDFLSSAEGSVADGCWTVSIDLPGRERPYAYTGKTSLTPAEENLPGGLRISGDRLPFVCERSFFCALSESPDRSVFGMYRDFLAALPFTGRAIPSCKAGRFVSWDEYRSLKTAHLLSLIERAPEGNAAYLAMGRRNGELQDVYNYTAGSFLVKSLEGALVLARTEDPGEYAGPFLERLASLFGGRKEPSLLRETAEQIGRFFLKGERRPGGHQDCYDTARNVWGGYLGIAEHDAFRYQINARCNGEVMKSYVLLYEELRKKGRDIPEFIELPRRVARFYLDRQLRGERTGSFGRWWSVDGKEVDSLGTNGAYIASFLIALEPHFDDRVLLDTAIEKAGAYYAGLAERGEFFGDTLDADSCDKEAGAALLALFLDLYERDGRRQWLDRARDAAEFLLSWIWQYDCVFPPESALGIRSFSTRGMTSVSVAHHHLDFYGMSIAYDFLRYAELSGDVFYRSQAIPMLRACRQLVADSDDPLGRSPSDIGWQPEQINHTDWDYFDRPGCRAGHFDIDIAWVTVLGLSAYQRIKDRFPEALDQSEKGE